MDETEYKDATIERLKRQMSKDLDAIADLKRRNANLIKCLEDLLASQRDHDSEYQINSNAGCYIVEVLAKNVGK